ncbi:MAG TPA: hypothetical protein VFX59_02190 [Polyangiales bacterium]|nr:hypothetical protein [Polyangiales bacterium]
MSQTRRAIASVLALVACSSLGCATEVASLASLKVSLAPEPGLSPLWLSHRLVGADGAPAAPLDLYIDDKPALPVGSADSESDAGFSAQSGVTLSSSAFLSSLFVSGGVHDVGFMRNGAPVAVAHDVELAIDRFSYVIAHGSDTAPAIAVISDRPASEPSGSRRIRIVNLRPDHSAATLALLDGAGAPVADLSATLAYGEVFSRSVPNTVSEAAISENGSPSSVRFACGHTELLVLDGGPIAPFGPVPMDSTARFGACATPDCSCPAP